MNVKVVCKTCPKSIMISNIKPEDAVQEINAGWRAREGGFRCPACAKVLRKNGRELDSPYKTLVGMARLILAARESEAC